MKEMFEGGQLGEGVHILGDSGYASKRLLLTPYLNPAGQAQTRYNRCSIHD